MIVRTKYKRYQFVLEWITLGTAVLWFAAALVLLYNFCDREVEIFKRNLLMMSLVLDVFAYLGFTSISFLPHGNALIKNERYEKGERDYRYQRESGLRTAALILKLVFTAIAIFMGLFKYIF